MDEEVHHSAPPRPWSLNACRICNYLVARYERLRSQKVDPRVRQSLRFNPHCTFAVQLINAHSNAKTSATADPGPS